MVSSELNTRRCASSLMAFWCQLNCTGLSQETYRDSALTCDVWRVDVIICLITPNSVENAVVCIDSTDASHDDEDGEEYEISAHRER
jgi:hypothetical protein